MKRCLALRQTSTNNYGLFFETSYQKQEEFTKKAYEVDAFSSEQQLKEIVTKKMGQESWILGPQNYIHTTYLNALLALNGHKAHAYTVQLAL